MMRSIFLLGVMVLALAGCVQPMGTTYDTSDYRVDEVQVDLSQFERVIGRNLSVPRETVERDLSGALRYLLHKETAGRSRPVDVQVKLLSIQLASPGQKLVVGGISSMTAMVSVLDDRTREVLIPPTKVIGSPSSYPSGVLGAVTTPTPEKDYSATVRAFAIAMRDSLFPKNS